MFTLLPASMGDWLLLLSLKPSCLFLIIFIKLTYYFGCNLTSWNACFFAVVWYPCNSNSSGQQEYIFSGLHCILLSSWTMQVSPASFLKPKKSFHALDLFLPSTFSLVSIVDDQPSRWKQSSDSVVMKYFDFPASSGRGSLTWPCWVRGNVQLQNLMWKFCLAFHASGQPSDKRMIQFSNYL